MPRWDVRSETYDGIVESDRVTFLELGMTIFSNGGDGYESAASMVLAMPTATIRYIEKEK